MDPISEFKRKESKPASGPSKWLLLVNPEAGSGIKDKELEELTFLLRASEINHDLMVSESYSHLLDHASNAASNGYTGVMARGGDGTARQVAAGILNSKAPVLLAVIPGGSGNDWARTVGIESAEHAVDSIMREEIRIMDAATCEIWNADGCLFHSSIFINSAGIGLDAHVLDRALNLRRKISLGKLGYVLALISTVVEMPLWKGRLFLDGSEIYHGNYLSMTSGVCAYTGGGMMLSPSSLPDDDMLDTAVITQISRLRLVRSVPLLFRGNILDNPAVTSWRGKEFRLEAEGNAKVELDGEWIPDIPDNSTVTFKSLPAAINVVGPG